MELEPADGAVFIYTFGVMFSALWLTTNGTPPLNVWVFAIFGTTSLFWTAYFKWKIAPQYVPDEDEDEEEEPETPRPPTARE